MSLHRPTLLRLALVRLNVLRLCAATAAAAVALLLTAGPAAAHVHVIGSDIEPGESGVLTFRVPTESDTASTVAFSVELPKDTPFADVATTPMVGWTVSAPETDLGKTVTTGDFTLTKAVTTVTWKADASGGIAPHQFEDFVLRVEPFPYAAGEMSFPATQTYSDGTVVHWNEPTPKGGDEPENPLPMLQIAAAPKNSSSDGLARWLGAGGLTVGVLGVAVAAAALLATRSKGRQPSRHREPAS